MQTTHVGSLVRNAALTKLIFAKEAGEYIDENEFDQVVNQAVLDTVAKQKAIGISIPSDGEMSKLSYVTYVKDRLEGFAGDSERRTPADLQDFPSFCEKAAKSGGTPTYTRPQCVAKIAVKNEQLLQDDLRRFKTALNSVGYEQGFLNAVSPGTIALFLPSVFHKNYEAYLQDLSVVMQKEYEAIVNAGLYLQIDSPDLGLGRHMAFADKSDADYLKIIALHSEVLNEALKNIDADRVRLHVCWGNYSGPHHKDIEIKKILPILYKTKPRTLLFESSNPRHAHEHEDFKASKLPSDYILAPGVIDSTTNFIEHPRLVAQRLKNFIDIVGKDRVLASTDCGFSTFAGFGAVDGNIVWEKFKSLVAGSELAEAL